MTRRSEFVDGGFFVLRTPLLPHDEYLRWSEGLVAPGSVDHGEVLEDALEQDRAMLRDRLRSTIVRPDVREALFVASPGLEETIERWVLRPDDERGQRTERALSRYFARITTRPTPFGLFAGGSVGTIGGTTELVIEGAARYRRWTSLDVHYLSALIEALTADPFVRRALRYLPNPTLHRVAGQLRYVERPAGGVAPSDALVAVEITDYLETTLARAEEGATPTDLAAALVGAEVSLEEATAYISELIESQILQAELAVPITGPEPVDGIIRDLAGLRAPGNAVDVLASTRDHLRRIDEAGLGAAPERYRALHQALQDLPLKPDLPSLFRVDLMKPSPSATLGEALIEEISRSMDVLLRLSAQPEDEELRRFKETFADRYESREVSLLEAIDEVVGGFRPEERGSGEALIDGLPFSLVAEDRVTWGPRERFLLRKLTEAHAVDGEEISLGISDLEEMRQVEPSRLPDAMTVMATLGASSAQALRQGDCQILFLEAGGPSGARLLGRFCHSDPVLRGHVERHLRAEEALEPEAIFAEVVHLPDRPVGNVACRPVLRSHEIPCFGRSGAPRERQIRLRDLFISLVDDELVLRSRRLGLRVFPRVTNPHNSWMRRKSVVAAGLRRRYRSASEPNRPARAINSSKSRSSSSAMRRITSSEGIRRSFSMSLI